jgi:hypothetical protein
MNQKILLGVIGLVCIGILAVSLIFYFAQPQVARPSWLALKDSVVYKQDFTWKEHNATEYMFWNVTSLHGDMADLQLVSHGTNVSDDVVSFPRTEITVTVNAASREVVALSDPSYYSGMPIGSKWPFWIPNSVKMGDTVETMYGDSTIGSSQSIDVMGKSRDCWVVAYDFSSETNMTRFYDTTSGICPKIQVNLVRNGVLITAIETAVQTNIDLP